MIKNHHHSRNIHILVQLKPTCSVPCLISICSVTVQSLVAGTYDWSLKFCPSQQPCRYMIIMQAFGNQLTLLTVTTSCGHMIAIFSAGFPQRKSMGKFTEKITSLSSNSLELSPALQQSPTAPPHLLYALQAIPSSSLPEGGHPQPCHSQAVPHTTSCLLLCLKATRESLDDNWECQD